MTVHATPAHGVAVTPCCGAAPVEFPEGDGLTLNPAAITCTSNHVDGSTS